MNEEQMERCEEPMDDGAGEEFTQGPHPGEPPQGMELVEVDGQAVPLRHLVDAAAFGSQAAAELQALREQEQIDQIAAEQGTTQETAKEMLAYRQEQQRRAHLAPYVELLQRYPELQNPARMPQEVAAAIRQGENPLVAYQDYLLERQQAAQQVGLQRDMLRARCPGSAAGIGDGEIDGALAAFDAVLYGDTHQYM